MRPPAVSQRINLSGGQSLGSLHPAALQPRARLCLSPSSIPNPNGIRAMIPARWDHSHLRRQQARQPGWGICTFPSTSFVSQSNYHRSPQEEDEKSRPSVHLPPIRPSSSTSVLFSSLPLSCSSCLPEKSFRLVQAFGFYSVRLYFCPLHCV